MESAKSFKRKMFLWANSWYQEDQPSTEEVQFTPNAVEIASLLRATGFRIRFMDRCPPEEMHPVPDVPADRTTCRVILMCPNSGLRMELDAPTSLCRCPLPDAGLGNIWTLSDIASEQMANVADSIAPRPSSEISKTVSQLIEGLFHVMNIFPKLDHNNSKDNSESGFSSVTKNQQSELATSTCNSPMKTPATGIAVVTPNAPCIPKTSPGESKTLILGRYRSLDTLIASGGFPDDLPEPGELTPKDDGNSVNLEIEMEVDVELDATIVEGPSSAKKKFISKSSPAIHWTEQFQRSNTFIFENAGGDADPTTEKTNQMLYRRNTYVLDAEDEPRVGPPPQRAPSPLIISSFSQPSLLLSKLKDIQQAVSDAIFMVAGNEQNLSNIGDVSRASKAVAGAIQRLTADNVRPIRSLSDFGSVPNLTRAEPSVRSIPRPNIRRHIGSTIPVPATPTTSRRGGIAPLDRKSIKKSTSMGSTTAGTFGKTLSTISRQTCNRASVSPAGSSLPKVGKSPSFTSTSSASKDKDANRKLINSEKKYTHLQSSIPKPSSARK